MRRAVTSVSKLGDYLGATYGPYDTTLAGMAWICAGLKGPVYGASGNSLDLDVPGLEAMGIRMLLNESESSNERGEHHIRPAAHHAHFYEWTTSRRASAIPQKFLILISHTPEVYLEEPIPASISC